VVNHFSQEGTRAVISLEQQMTMMAERGQRFTEKIDLVCGCMEMFIFSQTK
jgi:hypothetical protein